LYLSKSKFADINSYEFFFVFWCEEPRSLLLYFNYILYKNIIYIHNNTYIYTHMQTFIIARARARVCVCVCVFMRLARLISENGSQFKKDSASLILKLFARMSKLFAVFLSHFLSHYAWMSYIIILIVQQYYYQIFVFKCSAKSFFPCEDYYLIVYHIWIFCIYAYISKNIAASRRWYLEIGKKDIIQIMCSQMHIL
jgi:hypothetical protein